MPTFNFGKYRIITAATNIEASAKSLIISTHGFSLGGKFKRPFATVVQFCTPNKTALRARLEDVIAGAIAAHDPVTSSQVNIDDYDLTWFDGDPGAYRIEQALKDKPFDVLVVKGTYHVKLSELMLFLEGFKYLYPSILCVFCRVCADQYGTDPVSGKTVYQGQSVLGKKNDLVDQQNRHKVNATSLHHELMQLNASAALGKASPPPVPSRANRPPLAPPRP